MSADVIQFVPRPNPNRGGLSIDQFDDNLCTKLQDYYDEKRERIAAEVSSEPAPKEPA